MTRQELLLTQLTEECSEVIQNISKTLRFGKDEVYHKLDQTNAERVTEEMNDLLGVFYMLVDEGVLPNLDQGKIAEKKDKVEHYMKYSLSLQECQGFVLDNTTSSATLCICGKNKFEHK